MGVHCRCIYYAGILFAAGNESTPTKSNFLDIPSLIHRDKRSFSPEVLSPNIPPNPPTSPVEDEISQDPQDKGKALNLPASRKLNANAIPFVPGLSNFSIEKNHLATSQPAAKNSHDDAKNSTTDALKNSTVRQLDFDANSDAGMESGQEVGGRAGMESGQEVGGCAGTVTELDVIDTKSPWPNLVSSQTSDQVTADTRTTIETLGHAHSDSRTSVQALGQVTPNSKTSITIQTSGQLTSDTRTTIQTSGQVTADSTTASEDSRMPEGPSNPLLSPSPSPSLPTLNGAESGSDLSRNVTTNASTDMQTHTGTRMEEGVRIGSSSKVSTASTPSTAAATESADSWSDSQCRGTAHPPANLNSDPHHTPTPGTQESKHKPISSASSLSSLETTPLTTPTCMTDQPKHEGNTQVMSHEATPTHDLSQSSLSECSKQSVSESLPSPKLNTEGNSWPTVEGATPTVGGATPSLSATSSMSSVGGASTATGGRGVVKSWAAIVSKSADASHPAPQANSSTTQTQSSSATSSQSRTNPHRCPSERTGKEGGANPANAPAHHGRANGGMGIGVAEGKGSDASGISKGNITQLKMLGGKGMVCVHACVSGWMYLHVYVCGTCIPLKFNVSFNLVYCPCTNLTLRIKSNSH